METQTIKIKCQKAKFLSEKFALEHLEKIKKQAVGEKFPVDAYLCKNCGCWHLTSNKSASFNKLAALEIENKKLKQEAHELRICLAQSRKAVGLSPKAKLNDLKDKLLKTIEEHEQTIKQLRNSLNELLMQKLNAQVGSDTNHLK